SYTLTASEDRIYACLGGPGLGLAKQGGNHLVCLNRQPIPGGVKRWRVQARASDGTRALFEGAPIAYLSQVFVTVARSRESLLQAAIACYDADTGVLRWQQDMCESRGRGSSEKRFRQHLLTLAGPCLVYCSHAGAIVALDAATGRRLWAVRYLSRGAT